MATATAKRQQVRHAPTPAIALYGRVSTEDQAENDTIQTQVSFLHRLAELHEFTVAGTYFDEGVSGTVPLGQRPEGRRLLDDAAAGRFTQVVFMRVSRLGRRLAVLLDAHEVLEDLGVTIRSGTEPLDTSTAMGRFIFQMLGSIAELDRETISENTTRGRDRVAALGQYTGGPIPVGLDVDEAKRYVHSTREVPQLGAGMTEAAMVGEVFANIADRGATLGGEAARLTAAGVPRVRRYGGTDGTAIERSGRWSISSLAAVLHNPIYKGQCTIDSRYGAVIRPVPALIDAALWERAQSALLARKLGSRRNGKAEYALRGLIVCAHCGRGYTGLTRYGVRKYRCTASCGRADRAVRCDARQVDAAALEREVWTGIRGLLADPDAAMAGMRERLRGKLGAASALAERHKALGAELSGKDAEREAILRLVRKGKINDDEAERQLDEIEAEAAELRTTLDRERAQVRLIEAGEARFAEDAAVLAGCAAELTEIEATDDWARRTDMLRRTVREIVVRWDDARADWAAEATLRIEGAGGTIDSATRIPIVINCTVNRQAA